MTQDDIIKMADASGLSYYGMSKDSDRFLHHVETFAELVAAAQKEADAKLCEEIEPFYGVMFANAIRARGTP